jgi:hypothetical protein
MKQWEKLQYYIAEKLKPIDPKARPTKASGASTELGDVLNNVLMVEAKQRNTKNIAINTATWKKNKSSLPINSKRIPILALENKDKERFIVIESEDFFDLLYKAYKE